MSKNFLASLLLLLAAASPAFAAADKIKVKIEVEGLTRELRNNVLALLTLQDARGDDDLDEDRLRRLHAKAPAEIEEALQPFGYYKPTVQSKLEKEGDTWVARYTVDRGPSLQVTSTDVQLLGPGNDDPAFRLLADDFPLRQGETLFHPDYEQGKAALDTYAARNGYLDGAYETNQIRVDLANYTADVVVHYTTGPRYLFGPVEFRQDFLDPDVVRGYATTRQGEPLNVDKVLEMQNALSDSPYFERVEVVPRQDQAVGLEVPIVVTLTPAKRQRWTTGLGYGTDTGPRGSVGLELRRINRAGHRGRSELKASEIEQTFQAAYEIPGYYPRTDLLSFNVGYSMLDNDTTESETILVGATRSQARGRWREAISLNLQREDFEVGPDRGRAELILPGASWSQVRADNRIFTTKGYRLQLDLKGADRSLGSNVSLLQGRVDGKLIRAFADQFRFITRAQVGYTQTDDFRDLPATLRFFAGGDQSVRGYGYQELGEKVCKVPEVDGVCPAEAGVATIGGKALLAGSVEIEFDFLEKWRFLEKVGVAAFYDAGNAFPSFSGDLEHGAGMGLRFLSPIGPIRADAAFALSEPGTPLRFHLTIGPDL